VAGAAQDALDREHVARVVEVGGVDVEAQDAAGERRAGADERGARGALEGGGRGEPESRRAGLRAAAQREQRRPPVVVVGEVVVQRAGVRVGGGDEPARVQADAAELRASRVDGRDRRFRVQSRELGADPVAERPLEARRPPGAPVLQAVLGDGIAGVDAVEQPVDQRAGERAWNGCSCGAGMTSSVTRAMPRSSSQSRISAQRSKVAGSTSCSATATTLGDGGAARTALTASAPGAGRRRARARAGARVGWAVAPAWCAAPRGSAAWRRGRAVRGRVLARVAGK